MAVGFSGLVNATRTHRTRPSLGGRTRRISNDESAAGPNHFSTWNRKVRSSKFTFSSSPMTVLRARPRWFRRSRESRRTTMPASGVIADAIVSTMVLHGRSKSKINEAIGQCLRSHFFDHFRERWLSSGLWDLPERVSEGRHNPLRLLPLQRTSRAGPAASIRH